MTIHRVRWLLGGMLAAALIGCGEQHGGNPGGPKPAVVTISEVTEGKAGDFEDFTGRTEARESVEVKPRATGYINKVYFDDDKEKANQAVKKGQLLYEIDDRTYAADLKKAEAEVARGQALLERLRSDLGRARRMRVGDAISREEYDKISASMEETSAGVDSARATALRKKLDLDFCKVYAPIGGQISRTLVTAGNLVTADVTKLTNIVSVSPIYAYFDVDERTVLRIKEMIRKGEFKSARDAKAPVSLGTQIDVGHPHKGFIDFVDNRVDPARARCGCAATSPTRTRD